MTLSICIPSIKGREELLSNLREELEQQIIGCSNPEEVELITDVDNKEVSIGYKRNRMYNACKGEYAVQIDDDDSVSGDYVEQVLNAIKTNPDCVGYREKCVMDGVIMYSTFSNRFKAWRTLSKADIHGNVFHRTPFTKSPIKTEICRRVGVKDMRFAEDHDFAKRVKPHLRTEVFIDAIMYFYSADTLSKKQHNERYGIE